MRYVDWDVPTLAELKREADQGNCIHCEENVTDYKGFVTLHFKAKPSDMYFSEERYCIQCTVELAKHGDLDDLE